MRCSPVALFAIAGAALIGACSGERDTTAPAVRAVGSASRSTSPSSCNFDEIRAAGHSFILDPGDPLFPLINDMQTAYNAGGATAATSKGLDVLARVAKMRGRAAPAGTAAAGARLVTDVMSLSCTDLEKGLPSTTLAEFDPTAALTAGLFEVRGGGSGDEPAAVAYLVPDATRSEAVPRWGVEPTAGCSLLIVSPEVGSCTWPQGTNSGADKRYLLFGYPTDADLKGELAAFPNAFSGHNGFIVGTIPDVTDKSVFTVGACLKLLTTTSTGTPTAANLTVHATSALDILTNRSPTICKGYTALGMLNANRTWYASLTQRVVSFLAPTQLFAQDSRDDSFSGGGPSGWSPISFTKLGGTAMSPGFGPMPKNGVAGKNLTFTVHVATAAGHGVPGIAVTLHVGNNSGVPAGATLSPGGTGITVVTNDAGDANFSVILNKAGGYVLSATGDFNGLLTNGATSALFNLKNH